MLKRTYLHACFTVPEREKCVWTAHRGYRIQFAGLYLNVKPFRSHSRYHSIRFYFADVVPWAGTILCVKMPTVSQCLHTLYIDTRLIPIQTYYMLTPAAKKTREFWFHLTRAIIKGRNRNVSSWVVPNAAPRGSCTMPETRLWCSEQTSRFPCSQVDSSWVGKVTRFFATIIWWVGVVGHWFRF